MDKHVPECLLWIYVSLKEDISVWWFDYISNRFHTLLVFAILIERDLPIFIRNWTGSSVHLYHISITVSWGYRLKNRSIPLFHVFVRFAKPERALWIYQGSPMMACNHFSLKFTIEMCDEDSKKPVYFVGVFTPLFYTRSIRYEVVGKWKWNQ